MTQGEMVKCAAGHVFEHATRRGQLPKYCPEHSMFFTMTLSERQKCPPHVVRQLEMAGKQLNDPLYVKRWVKVWEWTMRVVAARAGSWRRVDHELVEEYVSHLRLSELHRLFAEHNPYTVTDSGRVMQHPGWERAKTEHREATRLADVLGFDRPRLEVRSKIEEEMRENVGSVEEENSDFVDDQIGPDGLPL